MKNTNTLQTEYDQIYSWIESSSEAFDDINWDGKNLSVILEDTTIETYSRKTLTDLKIIN